MIEQQPRPGVFTAYGPGMLGALLGVTGFVAASRQSLVGWHGTEFEARVWSIVTWTCLCASLVFGLVCAVRVTMRVRRARAVVPLIVNFSWPVGIALWVVTVVRA